MAAYLVAGALLVFGGFRYLERRDNAASASGAKVTLEKRGDQVPGRERERSGRPRIFVHVAGEVRAPGLYRLPRGARTAAAVARAGGPAPDGDLTLVNLAAPLQDGQQVVVPAHGAAPVGAASPGAPDSGAVGPLSLASATPEQLEELDGIGPTLAAAIIEYRDANGGFRSIEQLREVDGIGDKRFAALSEAVVP